MLNKLEALIQSVYKSWQSTQSQGQQLLHPDEEALSCFLEGRLSAEEAEALKAHLISCRDCSEAFSLNLKMEPFEEKEVPQEVLTYIRGLLTCQEMGPLLEIVLQFKEKAIEILRTSGDVLFGQEVVAASLLRARKIKDFRDEVMILKDFKDLRVEIRVENKSGGVFDLRISVKHRQTQKGIKDLRVTLIREDLELESYLADSGRVSFEHILLGNYKVEISNIDDKLATVLLDIKG
ncbi:MAG: zf-HC2 domain-containing protein [Candidatus Omnitrophota bacterium]|nr:zf-HC2 domain-containing protein [Candidatus Omnitrophota bacterium]